jgi:protein-disulfide isomerase
MPRIVALLSFGLLSFAGLTPAAAQDKGTLSNAQKEEIRQLVREYIIGNPEIIAEAAEALQAKEDKTKQAKQAVVVKARNQELYNPSEGTVIGNPKGDVTIVEFFDYNCGYCKSMFQAIVEVLNEDKKIRLVLKEFPILGPSSVTAAKAALAARKQNKYGDLHLALLGHKGGLNDGAIMEIAKTAGLDVKKLQEDMKDPEINAIIAKNRDLAGALEINGTPALFVGDEFVPGAVDKNHLREVIAAQRKN